MGKEIMSGNAETEKKEENPKEPKLNADVLREIFSGQAVFSNQIFVTLTPTGLRITFMENLDQQEKPSFRTAAFVPYPDAIAFRDVLVRQLEKVEVTTVKKETAE